MEGGGGGQADLGGRRRITGGAAPKKQRRYDSGKKKKHTHKLPLLITGNGTIVWVAIGKGRKHDFRVCKEGKTHLYAELILKAGSGYQGIRKVHPRSEVPTKRSMKKPLTPEQKAHNRSVSCGRVLIEQAIRKLKIFRLLAERYPNRRKRLGPCINLIAGIVNHQSPV